jgi:DNA-binding response OmpR family regulator
VILTPGGRLPGVFFLCAANRDNTERLYEEIWGADMEGDPDAVKKAVLRLRKKIEGSGYTIDTLYGEGYRFEGEPGCIVAKRSI